MKTTKGLLFLCLILALPLPAAAQVSVNINISMPPAVVASGPPQLVVLPETYVYVAPEYDVDIYFHDGWWWRSWDGRWYRSRSYNSGWIYYQSEPVFYRQVPREWRRWYRERRWRDLQWDHRPIAYHEVERNWRDWEERRYWERETTWYVRGLRPSPPIQVNVAVIEPPPIHFDRPPELVVIPETYVYAVPGLSIDMFFFDGWWWRNWDRRWYRSRSYSRGWVYYDSVPVFYRDIPRDWRTFYRDRRWRDNSWEHRPIPYREVERNWRDWEKRRYWEKQRHWDMRRDRREIQPRGHIIVQPPPPRNMQYERYDYKGPPKQKGNKGKKDQPKNMKEQRKYKMYD